MQFAGRVSTLIGPMTSRETTRIDPERLAARLAALAGVSTTRLAFTPEDREGRERVIDMMREARLDVRIDPATNIIGRRPGQTPGPAIACGSHIDTVPGGGSYDGALGSLAGIECLQTLEEAGIGTRHPFEVIVFANEEGQSFTGLMGSRAMAGSLDTDEIHTQDSNGRTLAEALREFGGDPERVAESVRTSRDVSAYLELHVEQGGVLESAGTPIGVVEGIVGIQYLEVVLRGRANHAGTTPMELRRDALVAASRFVLSVDEAIRTGDFCRVGTVGTLDVTPNARNVVPGEVRLRVDLRDLDTGTIDRAVEHLRHGADDICRRSHVDVQLEVTERMEPAAADPELMRAVAQASEGLGLPHRTMPSGAGHDAQMMARIARMGMIFVPSAAGVSHSESEFTSPEDCANGANVLLHTMLELDGGDELYVGRYRCILVTGH